MSNTASAFPQHTYSKPVCSSVLILTLLWSLKRGFDATRSRHISEHSYLCYCENRIMKEGFTIPDDSSRLVLLRGYTTFYRDPSWSLHEVPSRRERATVSPGLWILGSSRSKQTVLVELTSLFSSTWLCMVWQSRWHQQPCFPSTQCMFSCKNRLPLPCSETHIIAQKWKFWLWNLLGIFPWGIGFLKKLDKGGICKKVE